jgi:hypothetical protein
MEMEIAPQLAQCVRNDSSSLVDLFVVGPRDQVWAVVDRHEPEVPDKFGEASGCASERKDAIGSPVDIRVGTSIR